MACPSVGLAVLAVETPLTIRLDRRRRRQVIIGIVRRIPGASVADLKIGGRRRGPVHEVMGRTSGSKASAHAGREWSLHVIADQDQVARQDVDELLLNRMPVFERGLRARLGLAAR